MSNKIGYHIQAASPMTILFDLLRATNRSAGFTVVGRCDQIKAVIDNLPASLRNRVVGREYNLEKNFLDAAKPSSDPTTTARSFVNQLVSLASSVGLLDIMWQVYNEKMFDYEWMDKFVVACIDYNETLSTPLNFVFYNYATGCPEQNDIPKLRASLIKIIKNRRHKIGIHEYGYGGHMLGPDSLEPYRVGRYRWWRDYLLGIGFSKSDIYGKAILTEWGLDDPGWRSTGITPANYAQQLIDTALKYYESDDFILSSNIYDCSYLEPNYSPFPQDRYGTDTTIFYTLDARMKMAGVFPLSQPAAPPPPPVTPPPQPPPYKELGTPGVLTGSYRLRSGPSTDAQTIAVLPTGTKVQIEDAGNGWVKIYAFISSAGVRGG